MKTYYHATPIENLQSIINEGIKRNNLEKVVYLCEKPEDAAKFLRVHLCEHFVVIPVKVHERFIEESFDHSYQFFKCRAFMYHKDIPVSNINIDEILEYKN